MNDLFEQFKARAEAVSAEVSRFRTPAEAVAFASEFAAAHGPAVWAHGPWRRFASEGPGLSFEVTRETAERAQVGISQVEWGVAATGTLAQDASAAAQRLVSTLPPVHIALLPAARIVPDLAALFAAADPARCAYFSMITGPSRTADIERVLTIGVHGPERLLILAVDSDE